MYTSSTRVEVAGGDNGNKLSRVWRTAHPCTDGRLRSTVLRSSVLLFLCCSPPLLVAGSLCAFSRRRLGHPHTLVSVPMADPTAQLLGIAAAGFESATSTTMLADPTAAPRDAVQHATADAADASEASSQDQAASSSLSPTLSQTITSPASSSSVVLEVDTVNGIVYRTMTQADAQATARVVAKAFANGEALSGAAAVSEQDTYEFIDL
jgi:hypothetical protein